MKWSEDLGLDFVVIGTQAFVTCISDRKCSINILLTFIMSCTHTWYLLSPQPGSIVRPRSSLPGVPLPALVRSLLPAPKPPPALSAEHSTQEWVKPRQPEQQQQYCNNNKWRIWQSCQDTYWDHACHLFYYILHTIQLENGRLEAIKSKFY